MRDVIIHPSPNFGERDNAVPVSLIVLHYTGMKSGSEALAWLCNPKSQVSTHYMIEDDGRIFGLVDEGKRAWHAGKSAWRTLCDINSASIGIELTNPGHRFGYRRFPDRQIKALAELLAVIKSRYNLPAGSIVGHSDVAPERKEDPGELFPWQRLAELGFGFWPQPQPSDYGHMDDNEVQQLLRKIGYPCSTSGHYDPLTHKCLIAFQRRYEPTNLTGTPEPETLARIRALARMLDLA